ncbi:MAG: hypothetical protein GC161_15840 [Planctomycetaceae bacterium]|nr:hypothetical protein [Planctomycetaceae bacterium]
MPRLPPGPPLPVPEPTRSRTRHWLAAAWVGISLLAIAGLFWHQDWQYSQPTPPPEGLEPPPLGSHLGPPPGWTAASGRPLLVHVYNASCPCSRFAEEHLVALARRFEGRLDVLLLVEGDGEIAESRPALARLPRLADPEGRIAARYGVWTTPTAVLLDATGHLVYRGNYNASRYCVDPSREYVRLALEGLFRPSGAPDRPAAPPLPYGCPLPGTPSRTAEVRG